MEQRGVVGPHEGPKPRQVLLNPSAMRDHLAVVTGGRPQREIYDDMNDYDEDLSDEDEYADEDDNQVDLPPDGTAEEEPTQAEDAPAAESA